MSIDRIVIIKSYLIWESATSLEAFTLIMANRTDGSEGREVQSIHNKKKVVVEVGQEWRRTELENKEIATVKSEKSYASLNDANNVGLYYLYKYFHYNRQNIIKRFTKWQDDVNHWSR